MALEYGAVERADTRATSYIIAPAPPALHGDVPGLKGLASPLADIFDEMERCRSIGAWSGAAVNCRRLLEGIAADIGGDQSEKPLAAKLRDLAESERIKEPVLRLANAIRQGGNMGAHFSSAASPDEQMCEAMVGLAEYLLAYFYAIPTLIEKVEARLP